MNTTKNMSKEDLISGFAEEAQLSKRQYAAISTAPRVAARGIRAIYAYGANPWVFCGWWPHFVQFAEEAEWAALAAMGHKERDLLAGEV